MVMNIEITLSNGYGETLGFYPLPLETAPAETAPAAPAVAGLAAAAVVPMGQAQEQQEQEAEQRFEDKIILKNHKGFELYDGYFGTYACQMLGPSTEQGKDSCDVKDGSYRGNFRGDTDTTAHKNCSHIQGFFDRDGEYLWLTMSDALNENMHNGSGGNTIQDQGRCNGCYEYVDSGTTYLFKGECKAAGAVKEQDMVCSKCNGGNSIPLWKRGVCDFTLERATKFGYGDRGLETIDLKPDSITVKIKGREVSKNWLVWLRKDWERFTKEAGKDDL